MWSFVSILQGGEKEGEEEVSVVTEADLQYLKVKVIFCFLLSSPP
jgi:hypothetical protein